MRILIAIFFVLLLVAPAFSVTVHIPNPAKGAKDYVFSKTKEVVSEVVHESVKENQDAIAQRFLPTPPQPPSAAADLPNFF